MRAFTLATLLVLMVPLVAVAAPPVWGPVSTATIRPGSSATTDVGGCTYNFLYTDAAGNAYIGLAGHCTNGEGERVRQGSTQIGTVVYDSDVHAGANELVDFTLVELDANKVASANPTVRAWGGPTKVATAADVPFGTIGRLYGYGLGFGSTETTRARSGVVTGYDSSSQYGMDTAAIYGDSGGPVLTASGAAMGIVSHLGLDTASELAGPTMEFVLSELRKAGFDVSVAMATP